MASKHRRWNTSQRFKTDEDISASDAATTKPLQKWVDDSTAGNSLNDGLANMTLESSVSSQPWDQFAANREKFGIVPTYDELQYTTKVDSSHPDFAAREKRAIKIAREIEADSAGGNSHLAEERGINSINANADEEDLYSGVVREGKKQPTHQFSQQNKRQQYAAKEAQRAMLSPSYLQSRERSDESEDLRRFSQDFQVKGEVPEDLLPILGKKPRQGSTASIASAGSNTSKKSASPVAANSAPRKKKFDFSASMAKGSSFSPPPGSKFSPRASATPSPGASFIPMQINSGAMPMHHNPVMMPPGMPGMIPMYPMAQLQFYGMPPGFPMMPMHNGLSAKSMSPIGSDMSPEQSFAPKVAKPLRNDFDYIFTLKSKTESVPPIYATAPTWYTKSTVSYIDQLPAVPFAPINFVPWM